LNKADGSILDKKDITVFMFTTKSDIKHLEQQQCYIDGIICSQTAEKKSYQVFKSDYFKLLEETLKAALLSLGGAQRERK
jgi:hypothetical protein